jgi:hypothetical protein
MVDHTLADLQVAAQAFFTANLLSTTTADSGFPFTKAARAPSLCETASLRRGRSASPAGVSANSLHPAGPHAGLRFVAAFRPGNQPTNSFFNSDLCLPGQKPLRPFR